MTKASCRCCIVESISKSLIVSRYVNRVSDLHQVEEPPQFQGGIIADPMGLGKTLSMIALIASDIHEDPESRFNHASPHPRSSGSTLVIVPPPCSYFNYLKALEIYTNSHCQYWVPGKNSFASVFPDLFMVVCN